MQWEKARTLVGVVKNFGWLVVVVLLVGENAFAWGPATHLYYAKEVLHFSHLLPDAIRTLLLSNRADFLYGCVAADITLGKAFVEYIYNCHNFDVGWSLMKHAKTDGERAFVYGYNAHLAADTVSHHFFVPYQNVEHFQTARFRHAYWEVRLDEYFYDRVWHDVEEVIKSVGTHTHDRLLDGALKDTIFSFKTNKVLFSSMMAIQRLKKWQQFVRGVNKLSKLQFNPKHLEEYNCLAVSAIIRLLSDGSKSPVYRVDPTGKNTLEEAAEIRSSLKKMKRRKELTSEIHARECANFRRRVRERYFSDYPVESKNFHPSIDLNF